MLTSHLNQPTENLTTIMPSIIDQLTEDQEDDQGPTELGE